MMLDNVFDISIGFRFEKIYVSRTVHFYSLYLAKGCGQKFKNANHACSELIRIAITKLQKLGLSNANHACLELAEIAIIKLPNLKLYDYKACILRMQKKQVPKCKKCRQHYSRVQLRIYA